MVKQISLKELVLYLDKAIVKLKLDFVRELLCNASGSNKPWLNKDFSKKMGVKWNNRYNFSSAIKNWFDGKRNISFLFLKKLLKLSKYFWLDVENNLISIKAGTAKGWIYPTFPIAVNKELGSIVGHILGDGSIDKRYLQVSYSNKNKDLLSEFEKCMESVFGPKARIWYQESSDFKTKNSRWIRRVNSIKEIPDGTQGGLFYPKIVGLLLYGILGKFAFGSNKKLTQKILDTDLDFKKNLIRAFFDDEGTVQPEEIGVFQDNKKLLEGLREMLMELGIIPNKITYTSKIIRDATNLQLLVTTILLNFLK
jgi:hypothetical protein